jgi:uncharacterized membrane protein YkoI
VDIRSKLVTAAAIGAASVGGAAIATAATSPTTTPGATTAGSAPAAYRTSGRPHDPSRAFHTRNGRSEKLLTGSTAAKVRAAAVAKVSGTVERVETNVDSSAPYEAHIRKADGTEVEVQVTRDFTVAAVNQMGGMHP